MKCVLSAQTSAHPVVIYQVGDYRYIKSCLSALFQQTIIPSVIYIIINTKEQDLLSCIDYYNKNTILRIVTVDKEEDAYIGTSNRKNSTYLFSDSIIDRTYIERGQNIDKHIVTVRISGYFTRKILSHIGNAQTQYIDIYKMIPRCVKAYAKLLKVLHSIIHICKSNVIYILHTT